MFNSEISTQNTAARWSLFRHALILLSASIFTDGRDRAPPHPPLSGWLYAFMAAVDPGSVRLGALISAAIK